MPLYDRYWWLDSHVPTKTTNRSYDISKKKISIITAIGLCITLAMTPSIASATTEQIQGEVSQYLRMYNTQRYKKRFQAVSFNGSLAKSQCRYKNADHPDWEWDVVYFSYGQWSLGLRQSSDDVQFTRLQFRGQNGSGVFPETGGTAGDYATYFKINTLGSYCPDPQPMPFSGTLSY